MMCVYFLLFVFILIFFCLFYPKSKSKHSAPDRVVPKKKRYNSNESNYYDNGF
jgi:hypothetical protein